MSLLRVILFFACFSPFSLLAKQGDSDLSKADADGPYVFYQGSKVVVKYVDRIDTLTSTPRVEVHKHAKDVMLTCKMPDMGEAFSFPLHSEIAIPAWEHELPAKMLVLSDIEGQMEAFKLMLLSAGVIDERYNWTYGKGHLVLLGDFFDRGLNVTECLWLVYKLEAEAVAAGGMVHFVMGNHEVMNLSNDFRYVRNKYFENAKLFGVDYAELYNEKTELGRWLRSKNAVEKIGSYVLCHGGISPPLTRIGMTLQNINDTARRYYGTEFQRISEPHAKLIFNEKIGIFWCRHAAKNQLASNEVSDILVYATSKYMVIGHTLVPDLIAYYDGRIICVDLFHEENFRQGFMKTLFVENGVSFCLDSRGTKTPIFIIATAPGNNK